MHFYRGNIRRKRRMLKLQRSPRGSFFSYIFVNKITNSLKNAKPKSQVIAFYPLKLSRRSSPGPGTNVKRCGTSVRRRSAPGRAGVASRTDESKRRSRALRRVCHSFAQPLLFTSVCVWSGVARKEKQRHKVIIFYRRSDLALKIPVGWLLGFDLRLSLLKPDGYAASAFWLRFGTTGVVSPCSTP